MKKIFSLILACGATVALNAQGLIVSPSGMMDEIGMQAEGMSPNCQFAAGSNEMSDQIAIWDVLNEEIKEWGGQDTAYQPIYAMGAWEYTYSEDWTNPEPIDSVWHEDWENYDVIVGYDSTIFDVTGYSGALHAINNAGTAVGEYGGGYETKKPIYVNFDEDEVHHLYMGEGEDGGSAYAINADGSIIVGFYFDVSWTTTACIWKNGGATAADRVDLPVPTAEEFGGEIDYVSARWMSADASVILGYAQDNANGKWVMIYWTLGENDEYTAHAEYAKQYFTGYDFDLGGYTNPNGLYMEFEPQTLSENGKWVTLSLTEKYDPNDWSVETVKKAGRLNLETKELEVLDLGGEDGPLLFGIANNGTAVGSIEPAMGPGPGPMWAPKGYVTAETRTGYVWPADSAHLYTLAQLFPEEEYFNYASDEGEANISGISADASKIIGYTSKTDGVETWVTTSFIVTLPEEYPAGVENVAEETNAKAIKLIEQNQVVIIRDGVRYNVMGIRL